MPQLLRLRFVSIGHPQARMNDLLLDFQDNTGKPADSTLWLRNGGGKSSILNLFFAILRPHKAEFLGAKADAKQRALGDYILTGDRSAVAAEWQLDPPAHSLGLTPERYLTGVFYEKRDTAESLRRVFFASRVDANQPETTIRGLPLFDNSPDGSLLRRSLAGFKDRWLALRDICPQLEPVATENQRDWQQILESARIDPELYSYQLKMNMREGEADQLFRFSEPEEFVDFLLELALNPDIANQVGANIMQFRQQLVQRKEEFLPELQLVNGLTDRFITMKHILTSRDDHARTVTNHASWIAGLDEWAVDFLAVSADELAGNQKRLAKYQEEERACNDSRKLWLARAVWLDVASAKLARDQIAALLEQTQRDSERAEHELHVWDAAAPLQRALTREQRARSARQTLAQRTQEHEPLRQQLTVAARRFQAALAARTAELRRQEQVAQAAMADARAEAGRCRDQWGETLRQRTERAGEIRHFDELLTVEQNSRSRLIDQRAVREGERTAEARDRWLDQQRVHSMRQELLAGQIASAEDEDVQLERNLNELLTEQLQAESAVEKQEQQWAEAVRERNRLESDPLLLAALEVEQLDVEALDLSAFNVLSARVQRERGRLIELEMAVVEQERAEMAINERGLLPPAPDVQRMLDVLRPGLTAAWSGWEWISENAADAEKARTLAQQHPFLANGVIVRPADTDRALSLLREAGVAPDGPVVIAAGDSFSRRPPLNLAVAGPGTTAWYDKQAAGRLLAEIRSRIDSHRGDITNANQRLQQAEQLLASLRAFRQTYAKGWFARAAASKLLAAETAQVIAARRDGLAARRSVLKQEIKQFRLELDQAKTEYLRIANVLDHLREHHEHYEAPAVEWRRNKQHAETALARLETEVEQWRRQETECEQRAAAHNRDAARCGEDARAVEEEARGVRHAGVPAPEPADGPVEELRHMYNQLLVQYEQAVGADALEQLAARDEEDAKVDRAQFIRLLSAGRGITEEQTMAALASLGPHGHIEERCQRARQRVDKLFRRLGELHNELGNAGQRLKKAEAECRKTAPQQPEMDQTPDTHEQATALAAECRMKAEELELLAHEARVSADHAAKSIVGLNQRTETLRQQHQRLLDLRGSYLDILPSGTPARQLSGLDEASFAAQVKQIGGLLQSSRARDQELNARRDEAARNAQAWLDEPAFASLRSDMAVSLRRQDPAALERNCLRYIDQCATRSRALQDQLASIDKNRAFLVNKVLDVADEGLRLLRSASNLSRLPSHLPGLGGAQFLTIKHRAPDDPGERRGRLGELIDEFVASGRSIGGLALVQAAVRKLARPVHVRVLHPDPALDRRQVAITDVARFSGGEQLTGAILLYCTLARVRANSRGLSQQPTSVLLLDNPIGRVSRVRFLELQRDVARAMGVQLIYATAVNDNEALRALPNIIRLRNERIDRRRVHRLIEPDEAAESVVEAARIARISQPSSAAPLPAEDYSDGGDWEDDE